MANVIHRNTVGRQLARVAIDEALAAAGDEGGAYGVAVVGSTGELVEFAKMDGAPIVAAQIARDKAYTAAAFGVPTQALAGGLRDDTAMLVALARVEHLLVIAGGAPIVVDGETVGAVGVSGGSAEQDSAIAERAAGHAGSLPS